ncbi:MAG: GIY-YIG nuclease family protein [Chromatiales bacterium]|nr:GIY-YIG nuclease family protein [Chromatiales bacterium]
MAKIELANLLDIDTNKLDEYKLHAAVQESYGKREPLDEFIADGERAGEKESAWWGWQAWYQARNRWTRKYILSFMRVYSEGENVWLFGGIFEVKNPYSKGDKVGALYDVHLTEQGKEWIGRLKITYNNKVRQQYLYLENVYDQLEFSELLKSRYSGQPFCGYENVSLDFTELEAIVNANRNDWRTALQNNKGIYVIFDKQTGKKYVGSAYGESGIWHRWRCYVDSLHGGNKELKELLANNQENDSMRAIFQSENPLDYVRKNFRFTLIECWPFKTSDEAIIHRENFWKGALHSRGEFGYNAN